MEKYIKKCIKEICQRKIYSIKQINDTEKNSRIPLFDRKRSYLKESGAMAYGKREVEVGSLLLGNDKNYVFTDIFFYF